MQLTSIYLEKIFSQAYQNSIILLKIIGVFFCLNLINWKLLRNSLLIFGVIPRTRFGLIGIVTSVFLHADFTHFLFNSIPFFALSLIIISIGWPAYLFLSITLSVIGSAMVWLFGRGNCIHVGASGLVSSYFGAILALAYFSPNLVTVVVAVIVVYYFGAIFFGIFPSQDRSSWESHLAGFIAGLGLIFALKNSIFVEQIYQSYLQLWP